MNNPLIPIKTEDAGQKSTPDFKAVGRIIDGGADLIFNRYNIGLDMDPKKAKENLLLGLARAGAYFHQLETLQFRSEKGPEHFGVYFELDNRAGQKQLGYDGRTEIPCNQPARQESGLENIVIPEFKKVPERTHLGYGAKWKAAMLAWNLKERARMAMSKEPTCKGLIVIDQYGKNSVIEYAIAAKSDHTYVFEQVAAMNKADNLPFKMFDTSFIMEKTKPITTTMRPQDLASLNGHARGIGYEFCLTKESPIRTYAALAKKFGYKAGGVAIVPDPVFPGAFTNGSQWFDLDNMPKTIPGMGGVQLVGRKGNQIRLDKDDHRKNTYSITLSDLGCDIAKEFIAEFTNEMGRLGATTSRTVKYDRLFDDHTTVYLPGFPMANESAISLSYRGDLSHLRKD